MNGSDSTNMHVQQKHIHKKYLTKYFKSGPLSLLVTVFDKLAQSNTYQHRVSLLRFHHLDTAHLWGKQVPVYSHNQIYLSLCYHTTRIMQEVVNQTTTKI